MSTAKTQAKKKNIRLSRRSNGMEMTSPEFDGVEDWDLCYRFELVRGVVIVNPLASDCESAIGDRLGYFLRSYLHEHPNGSVLDLTLPERYIYLPDGSRRRADRVIWAGLGRVPDPKKDPPSRRDRQRDYEIKRAEYRQVGIAEYWIVDRFQRIMTVSFADGTECLVQESMNYETPRLPGFVLPLQTLLTAADRWKK